MPIPIPTSALLRAILVPLALALVLATGWGVYTAVRPAAVAGTEIGTVSSVDGASDATTLAVKKYSMATVKKHHTASSCWTVVGTGVYNVTKWIPKHPGGKSRIIAMCGKKATTKFRNEHGTGGRANSILASYKIGKLK
jgi:cytochrome b involved in lipid metabolism